MSTSRKSPTGIQSHEGEQPRLKICLLGGLRVSVGDDYLPESVWRTRHARLSLGILVCAQGPVSVEKLAALLWPGRESSRAVLAVRMAVLELRKVVEPRRAAGGWRRVVTSEGGYLLVKGPDCWVDVDEFEACLREVLPKDPWTQKDWEALLREGSASNFQDRALRVDLPRLEAALSLYRADFLWGEGGDEAVGLDRDRFRELYLRGVETICRGYAFTKRPGEAVEWALKGLAADRSREELYRWWMWAHYSWGNRAEASEVYHKCREALKKELGVGPDRQTEKLYLMAIGAEEVNSTPKTPSRGGKGVGAVREPPLPRHVGEGGMAYGLAPRGERSSSAPFVGREAEMDLLEKGLEGMLRGRRSAFAILGETGIGKSLLVERLGRVVEEKGTLFVATRCDQWLPSYPWDPLSEAVRQIIRALVDEFVDPMPEKAKVALRAISNELGALVPEMTDKPPIPPGYDRPQLFAGLVELVKHAAGCNSLVLLLEDMHWARPTFLDWLAHALKRLPEDTRVMLVMTCRTEEAGGAEFRRWLEAPAVKRRVREIELGRLERGAVLEYVRRQGDGADLGVRRVSAALPDRRATTPEGPAAGHRLASYLWRETEGHPLLLAELWRLLVEDGRAKRRPDGAWDLTKWPLHQGAEEPSVPDRLRKAVLMRAETLGEEAKFLLQTGSVFGMAFDPEEAAAIGQVHGDAGAHLEELVARGFVRPAGSGSGRAEFVHDKVRLGVYSGLSDLRRRYTHLKLAEKLEAEMGSDPGLISYHYLRAGFWEKALPHFERAVEVARAHYSWGEAAWLLERVLEIGRRVQPLDWEKRELACRLDRGDFLAWSGRNRDAEAELREAMERASSSGDVHSEIRARRGLARVMLVQGKTGAARECAARGLELAEQGGSSGDLMDALWGVALVSHWRGQLEEGLECYSRSLSLARSQVDRRREASCLNLMGVNFAQRGEFGRAIQCLKSSLSLRRKLGNRFGVASSLVNLASVLELLGRLKEAESTARSGLRLAEEIGYVQGVAGFHSILGEINLLAGKLAEAEASYGVAADLFEEAGSGLDRFEPYCGLSGVAAKRGQAEAAVAHATAALEICVKAECPQYEAISRRALGEALIVAEELDTAKPELAASVETLERIGARPEAARSRAALARCALAMGQADEAMDQEMIARGMFEEMGMAWS